MSGSASPAAVLGGRLDGIQLLRALAAAAVVFGHVGGLAALLAAGAHSSFQRPMVPTGAGVDLFFVISGFIMVTASRRLFQAPRGASDFLLRRLVRIVPLYWGVTTLALLLRLIGGNHSMPAWQAILASYAFWPFDTTGRGDGFVFPIVDLGWTLNYEMMFYAVFALFIALPRVRCVLAVSGVLVVVVAAGAVINPHAAPLRFWSQPIVLEFACGMWIALGHGRWLPALRAPVRIAMIVLGLALLAWDPLPALHAATTPNTLDRVIGWGLPAILLVIAAVTGPVPIRGLGRFFVRLGDSSYSLYLVHPYWLLMVTTAARRIPALPAHPWLVVAIAFTGAIAAAFVCHYMVERPITRRLTRALQREGAPMGAVPLVDARS